MRFTVLIFLLLGINQLFAQTQLTESAYKPKKALKEYLKYMNEEGFLFHLSDTTPAEISLYPTPLKLCFVNGFSGNDHKARENKSEAIKLASSSIYDGFSKSSPELSNQITWFTFDDTSVTAMTVDNLTTHIFKHSQADIIMVMEDVDLTIGSDLSRFLFFLEDKNIGTKPYYLTIKARVSIYNRERKIKTHTIEGSGQIANRFVVSDLLAVGPSFEGKEEFVKYYASLFHKSIKDSFTPQPEATAMLLTPIGFGQKWKNLAYLYYDERYEEGIIAALEIQQFSKSNYDKACAALYSAYCFHRLKRYDDAKSSVMLSLDLYKTDQAKDYFFYLDNKYFLNHLQWKP